MRENSKRLGEQSQETAPREPALLEKKIKRAHISEEEKRKVVGRVEKEGIGGEIVNFTGQKT